MRGGLVSLRTMVRLWTTLIALAVRSLLGRPLITLRTWGMLWSLCMRSLMWSGLVSLRAMVRLRTALVTLVSVLMVLYVRTWLRGFYVWSLLSLGHRSVLGSLCGGVGFLVRGFFRWLFGIGCCCGKCDECCGNKRSFHDGFLIEEKIDGTA